MKVPNGNYSQQPLHNRTEYLGTVSVTRALQVSCLLRDQREYITHNSIQKHALTCLLCRYYTLGLKSVLRLPVHGIVIAMVYAWFKHYCVHIRMTWRTFLLNSYKLRILYALKEDKQGENSRHTHSLCETACRLRVHTQHTHSGHR